MNKKLKKILSVILSAVLLFTTVSTAFAAEETRAVVDSGYCGAQGENLTWTLTADGELVISGEGEMDWYFLSYSIESSKLSPWHSYYDKIDIITVEEGVSTIGHMAFYPLDSKLNDIRYFRINLPKSLKSFNSKIYNKSSSRCVAICYAGSEENWNQVEFKHYDYKIRFEDETWFEKAYTNSTYGFTFGDRYIMYFNDNEPRILCDLTAKQDKYNNSAGKEVPIYVKFYSETDADKIVFYSILQGEAEKINEVKISDISWGLGTTVILPEGKKGDMCVRAEVVAADGAILVTSDDYLLENTSVDHRTLGEKIKDGLAMANFTVFFTTFFLIIPMIFAPITEPIAFIVALFQGKFWD